MCKLAGTIEHAVIVERDFNPAASALDAESNVGLAFTAEELVQFADLLLSIDPDFGVELQLLFYKVEFHAVHSFSGVFGIAGYIIQYFQQIIKKNRTK